MFIRLNKETQVFLLIALCAGLSILVVLGRSGSTWASDEPGDVLKTLRPGHPRLFVLNEELLQIKQAIKKDPLVRKWYDRLQQDARKMLDEPPVEYKLTPRLLGESRRALSRISTLAGLYRLDGDRQKASRARTEMLTAAAFKDWNPPHFLDTAEMTTALAIGYDWLFDYLSAEDRATIRNAIVDKGLKRGLEDYIKSEHWTRRTNNWNQVCNGGMTVGALAIADEEPKLAREIVDRARTSIVISMRRFAPDGGFEEGPGYWNYATRYNVFYLAALKSALGTDFGFEQMQGFVETGLFRIHSTGPTGLRFNYADATERTDSAAQMLWFAREFNRPVYAAHEREIATQHPTIFHLLWSGSAVQRERDQELPRDVFFRRVHVTFFRTAWKDSNAIFIGFKGGNAGASHRHADMGNFVLDAMGERWAIDLGPDTYELPGYFDYNKQRWDYYRMRTEGHNTLTIDGGNQDASVESPLVAFLSTPQRAFAVAELSEAYKPKVTDARRGIALLDRRRVLVQDEVRAREPVEIVWNFHTRARVEPKGATAILSQGRARLEARILSPAGARFDVISANPPPPQAQQPDVHNLIVRLPERVKQARIAVLFTIAGDSVSAPTLESLDSWVAAGKLQGEFRR
jgi:hypothetical protein